MLTNQQSAKGHKPFIGVTLLFMLVSFLDRLIPEGMFFDGMIYSAISRNMAIGKGSFWAPYYFSDYGFWEHPPLMFGITSIFYKIFGDHYFTEKIFSFAVWLCTVLLIRKLWDSNNNDKVFQAAFWLPLLFWAIDPCVLWSYPNNLLDSMMGLFDLAAFIIIYNACKKESNAILEILLGGVFIFCATLTKGPVGIFPVAVPFIFWLVFHKGNFGKAILNCSILFIVVAIIYTVLWQFPAPQNNFRHYLDDQLLSALAGHREKVQSSLGRFALLAELGIQLLPAAILGTFIIVISKWLKPAIIKRQESQQAVFFIFCGLCASLPIMISIKQSAYYLLPAIPYYITGIALFVYPYMQGLIDKQRLSLKANCYFNILFVCACIGAIPYLISKAGTIGREEELINDLQQFSKVIPDKEKISICHTLKTDYDLGSYAERYHQWEFVERSKTRFVISDGSCSNSFADSLKNEGFIQKNMAVRKYHLYQRNQ